MKPDMKGTSGETITAEEKIKELTENLRVQCEIVERLANENARLWEKIAELRSKELRD